MSQKFELKNASHNIRKIQTQNFCMKQYEKKGVHQNKKKTRNNGKFRNLILCKTYIVDVIFKKSTFSQFIFVITFFQQKTFYPHFILKFQIIHYFRSALEIFVNNRAHSSERSQEQTKVLHEARGDSESGLPKASIKNDTMKHTEQ